MKKSVFILCLMVFAVSAFSQNKPERESNKRNGELKESSDTAKIALPYKVKFKYADAVFGVGNYYEAIDIYQELINEKPGSHFLAFRLAESYRLARDYVNAEKIYQKIIETGGDEEFPMAYYYFAQMLKMNEKYEEAKYAFARFSLRASGNSKLSRYEARATKEIEACDFAKKAQDAASSYEVFHLDSTINKPYSEFAPYASGNAFYFSSFHRDINQDTKRMGIGKSQIYRAVIRNSRKDSLAAMPSSINSEEFHSGNCSFTPDGKKMYFTRCSDFGEANIHCKIYFSVNENGVWKEPVEISEVVNNSKYNSTQPAVAVTDGGSDILYFSSDMPGGKGGYDIWYSEVDGNGIATLPVNLGEKINTDEDEKTPFYYKGKLYFSSGGHTGLGGLDIFSASGIKDGWTVPTNLGYPVNSSADDMYFTKGNETRQFYFVSNRPGIIGYKSATCCDDIFMAKSLSQPSFWVKGKIFEKTDTALTVPLIGVRVEVYEVEGDDRKLVNENLLAGESQYFYSIGWDKEYLVKFFKKGYFTEFFSVSTIGLGESDTFIRDISLAKLEKNKAYRLDNIYYGSGESTLKPESKATLNTLNELLVENPKIVIELSAHTDSIGTEIFNLDLSQKRAQRCVDYLISLGISANRLVAKGYGESKPVAKNSLPNGTDNAEGRKLNRRTEFSIIGELSRKGDKIIYD